MKKLLSLLTVMLISSGTVSSITSCSVKESLSGLKTNLKSDTLVKGTPESLYDNIDAKIADYLKKDHKDITVDDVKNDAKLSLTLKNKDQTLAKDDHYTLVLAGTELNLNLNVKAKDQYFKANNFSLPFIVNDTFTGKITDVYNVTNGASAYEQVRAYLVNLYNQDAFSNKNITTKDIKNDNNIQIAIWSDNKMIADNDNMKIVNNTLLTIKFTILKHDAYFAPFPQTNFTVISHTSNMILDKLIFASNLVDVTTAKKAYNFVRTEIADAFNLNTDSNIQALDIANDDSIQISIWDGNTCLDDDDTTQIAYGTKLEIKANVIDGDKYFAKTETTQIADVQTVTIFTKEMIQANLVNVFTGTAAYDAIRNEIATAYNFKTGLNITVDTIKNDENLGIAIWNGNTMIADDNTAIAPKTLLTIKVVNNDYDNLFAQIVNDVESQVSTNLPIFDSSIIPITLNVANGKQIYNAIRTAIANAYNVTVKPTIILTAKDAKNDKNLGIAIWNGNTMVADDNTLFANGTKLTIKLINTEYDNLFAKIDGVIKVNTIIKI